MCPNSLIASSTTSRHWAGSLRSPATRTARRPASSTYPAVCLASSCSERYAMSTSAPSRANAIATARPIPLSPPVMMAALPVSRPLPR